MINTLITGINSYIGNHLAINLQGQHSLSGTYRNNPPQQELINTKLYQVDFSDNLSIENWLAQTDFTKIDNIVFIHGTLVPVGKLSDVDFESWHTAYTVNYLSIVKTLNHALKYLKPGAKVVSLAGGGVNSAPTNFHAYTSAKVALIKMTELLAAEYPEHIFINIGPGWVDTPIHQQTLEAAEKAPAACAETERRYRENDFVPLDDVTQTLVHLLQNADQRYSGRNFSVANGELFKQDIEILLREHENFKLRRYMKAIL